MTDYLTRHLPGTGGSLRQQREDFQVEEIPLYEPCGQGDHLYLRIEKQGLTTYDVLRELASALGCPERDLGYAGLKDARAITRQTISVPLRKPDDVKGLQIPGVRILDATLHQNKLRPGHLAGNRFRIRIHQPGPEALARARQVLDELQARGVPNRFGEQRYGAMGNSHRVGRALLAEDYPLAIREIIGAPEAITHPGWREAAEAYAQGDLATAIDKLPRHCRPERRLLSLLLEGKNPRNAVRAMPRNLLKLYLSAYQSHLFDRLLAMRLASFGELWPGDIAFKHLNGACFQVLDPELEQPRADRFEISPTAPLYGFKVKLASARAGKLEANLLDEEQLSLPSFRLPGGLALEGERRPLRIPLHDATCQAEGEQALVVSFALPKGSFATTVLAEIMKTDAA